MAQTFGFMLYVLGLGLAICVLDSITGDLAAQKAPEDDDKQTGAQSVHYMMMSKELVTVK